MVAISSWGRLASVDHPLVEFWNCDQVRSSLKKLKTPFLAYGMARSYGDVCLNPGGTLLCTVGLDHFVAFDDINGRIICEAGVLLRDIQRLVIPRGWILPVTPGTQLVTVGGAIANDVHGKNHHALGSFGNHVVRLQVVRSDGEVIHCGPNNRADWFAATVGGMGLTGVITQVEIQLRSVAGPWLSTETVPYSNLDEFFRLADESEHEWEHTVSWVDCISGGGGRGIFTRANPSIIKDRPAPKGTKLTMPVVPPISLVNRFSLHIFNIAYYHLSMLRSGSAIKYYESVLCPLDNVLEWNRIYGPKGFFQYQSLIPREDGKEAVQAMLNEISRFGDGSFLAVLKTFGDRQPVGMMSFPQPGVTLALDFPNRDGRTEKLFQRLDSVVREAKGRLYPAKDARMPKELFAAGYPRLEEFIHYRDPGISSGFSRRLMGH